MISRKCGGLRRIAAGVVMLAALVSPTLADDWPNRPITMVVPYPPGGSIDIIGRMVAQKLQESLGQTVVIENRPGAAGTIGAGVVSRATPDGYTILMSASVHVISPYILKTTQFDPVDSFGGITEIASGPLLITTNLKNPAKNIAEFVRLAKQNPERFTFSTSGYGAAGHLAVELLRRIASPDKSKTTLVNFNGAAPALTQLMVGDIDILIDPVPSSYPFVAAGNLRALGVTGSKRISLMPEVPTVTELGLPELEFYSWYGLWGPKGLPRAIAERLSAEVKRIVATPEIAKRLAESGFEARGTSPEDFSKYLVQERDKYKKILTDLDISAR